MQKPITRWTEGISCCNERWETAYNRFDTREQEIAKFRRRLRALGCDAWPRDSRIVDLFCGSGRNLECLESLGFHDLHGVDLSPRLIEQYTGGAARYVGDATDLHFPDAFSDVVIVQGGLHHLPGLPGDLAKCLSQIRRILKPGGTVVIVEPWLTPMLRLVHWGCRRAVLRAVWPKLDALAIMIEEEIETYSRWLDSADMVLRLLEENFTSEIVRFSFGKIAYRGRRA